VIVLGQFRCGVWPRNGSATALCGDRVAVGVEDLVEGFDAAAVDVDVGHDEFEGLGAGADVFEQVEVGVEEVAAAFVELVDVAGGDGDLDALG
jgi:hypothetical protein